MANLNDLKKLIEQKLPTLLKQLPPGGVFLPILAGMKAGTSFVFNLGGANDPITTMEDIGSNFGPIDCVALIAISDYGTSEEGEEEGSTQVVEALPGQEIKNVKEAIIVNLIDKVSSQVVFYELIRSQNQAPRLGRIFQTIKGTQNIMGPLSEALRKLVPLVN